MKKCPDSAAPPAAAHDAGRLTHAHPHGLGIVALFATLTGLAFVAWQTRR